MSSKLVSLARIAVLSKAAAARSAPAAIIGPLQRILGGGGADDTADEEQQQQQHERGQQAEANREEGRGEEDAMGAVHNATEATTTTTTTTGGIFASMVARAEAAASGRSPVDRPEARRELRDFRVRYYRREIAAAEDRSDPVGDRPDLSIPVGDEYLYLAQ